MIKQTFDRYDGIIDIDHVWAVTSKIYKDLVLEQLQGINPECRGYMGALHELTSHDDNNNAVFGNNFKIVEVNGCMVRMTDDKPVVIQGLKDCIVAEHNNTLVICQLSKERRIKEWHN